MVMMFRGRAAVHYRTLVAVGRVAARLAFSALRAGRADRP